MIGRAESTDQAAIVALFAASGLPTAYAVEHLDRFRVARDEDDALLGVATFDLYGDAALIRGAAAGGGARSLSATCTLCRELIEEARRAGAAVVYLQSAVAQDYFRRLGFHAVDDAELDARVHLVRGAGRVVTLRLSLDH